MKQSRNEVTNHQETSSRLEKELEETKDRLLAESSNLKSCQEEVQKSKDQISEMEETITHLRNTLEDVKMEHLALLAELEVNRHEITKSKALLDTDSNQMVPTNIRDQSVDHESCISEKKELEDLLKSMEADDKELAILYEAEKKQLQSMVDKLGNELAELKNKGGLEEQNTANFLQELTSTRNSTSDIATEVQRLKDNNVALLRDVEALRAEKKAEADKYNKALQELEEESNHKVKDLSREMRRESEKMRRSIIEVNDLEKKCEEKLQQLQDAHFHELEVLRQTNRENLSNVKASYERDMRALRDRSDENALRLQKLHEEEIAERESELGISISRSFPDSNRLEASHQTELAALHQHHIEEKDKLSKKLASELHKMKDDHKKKMEELAKKLTAELHKQEDANKKELKEAKIKPMMQMIDAGPLDDLTGQVQKELDVSAQLDSSLMNKLTPSEETDEDTCKCSSSNTLLQKVLKKVLQHGMDVLTFNELTFLHQATCTATDTMANAEFNTPTPEHAKGDHQQMQRQIAALENEITRKQMDAAKRVHELEQAVRQEKKRIGDLHETLNQEQRRNLELQQHIKMQTHMQTDLELEKGLLQQQTSYHEDRLEQFIMMLEQERSKVRGLEDDLQKEKNTVKHLESLLEAERARAKATKFKDSELIESMRIKLENALDDATKQRFQMEEVQQHASLNKYDRGSEDNHKLHNATDYLAAQRAEIEVLGHKVQMLEDVERQWQHQQAVERVQAEAQAHNVSMQQLEMEQKILELEQKLLDSASGVSHVAASKAKDLARLREKLTEAQKELVTSKVQEMLLSQELTKLQHTLTVCQSELAGKKTQEALSNQELSRLREVLTDRQDKLVSLKIKETELKQEVSQLQHENFRSLKASEPFLQKLKNMNASLDQHMKDNTEVALTLARLVEERQVYEARIREMGECLAASQAQVQTSEANCQTIGTLLAAERLAWAREKTELQHDLAETHNQRTADTITDDRVNHLFGMYLRAESFRKALVWQKRYLLVVLGCYEDTEAATVSRLAQLSDVVYTQHKPSTWTTARTRFRSAVIVIISIQRMRYLVRRWHCGRRIGSSVVLSLVSGQSSYHDSRKHNSTRSLGLPRMGHSAERLLSPPSRDQPPQYWQHWRSSDPPPSSSQPSNCLADYVDRFDQLQHRLGLAIVHSPS